MSRPASVVDILDSDEEDGGDHRPQVENNDVDERRLENRSFWKAGAFDIGPTKWTPSQGYIILFILAVPS
nr:protein microrchidia 2-like [Tanacetum cinerariifolium]